MFGNKSLSNTLTNDDVYQLSDPITFARTKILRDYETYRKNTPPSQQEKDAALRFATDSKYIYDTYFGPMAVRRFDLGPKKEFKVKIIISNLDFWSKIPRFARFFVTPLEPVCGYLQIGLQIGPWIFQWFENSLVYVDQNTVAAIVAIDVGSPIDVNDTATLQTIANTFVEWNCTKMFSSGQNHQLAFVTDVLKRIKRDNFANEKVQDIISVFKNMKVIKQGIIEQLYECKHDAFKNAINNKIIAQKIVFTSHKQLDEYVHKLLEEYVKFNNSERMKSVQTVRRNEYGESAPRKQLVYNRNSPLNQVLDEFKIDFPLDFALLKSYDRAYWWQFTKEKMKAKAYGREANHDDCNTTAKEWPCPFQDPSLTGSIPLATWNKEFDEPA